MTKLVMNPVGRLPWPASAVQEKVARNYSAWVDRLGSVRSVEMFFSDSEITAVLDVADNWSLSFSVDCSVKDQIHITKFQAHIPYLGGEAQIELEAKLWRESERAARVFPDANLIDSYHRDIETWVGLFIDDSFERFSVTTDLINGLLGFVTVVADVRRSRGGARLSKASRR